MVNLYNAEKEYRAAMNHARAHYLASLAGIDRNSPEYPDAFDHAYKVRLAAETAAKDGVELVNQGDKGTFLVK